MLRGNLFRGTYPVLEAFSPHNVYGLFADVIYLSRSSGMTCLQPFEDDDEPALPKRGPALFAGTRPHDREDFMTGEAWVLRGLRTEEERRECRDM